MIVTPDSTAALAIPRNRHSSPWRRLARDHQAVVAGSIIVGIVIIGIVAPLFLNHGVNDASLAQTNASIGTAGYPLGADQNGRDILSRLILSIRTSALSALICVSVALAIGIPAGLVGGYFGRVRGITEWVFTLIMTVPGVLLLVVLMPLTHGDFRVTMAIFGVLVAPAIYRIVRNEVVGVEKELYIDAARVSGLSHYRILARHVLYVVRGPVIIAAAFLVGTAINIQSGLAFLGVGTPTTPSFGGMISVAFTNLYVQPSQLIWPAALLGIMVASSVLFGSALRDAFEGVAPKVNTAKLSRAIDEIPVMSKALGKNELMVVDSLAIGYPGRDGDPVNVVHAVSLTVAQGETLGLVGESGSGKTQTAFAMMGLLPPEAVVTAGSIELAGFGQVRERPEIELSAIRGKEIGYIPQEPMSNLAPTFTVGSQLVAGLRASTGMSKKEAKQRILDLLSRCGIPDPTATFASYPHEISGGMAQRALIAGAVAPRPRLLIADEPTTALDVTVQAEILDLLRDLQAEIGMGIVLVTHNFGVVADLCDRVVVMQGGKSVEEGSVAEIFDAPKDPYTQKLLASILDETTVRQDGPLTDPIGVLT